MSTKLTFHPAAWFLYQFLCHRATTEVGGYGVTRDLEKPLYVHDLVIPQQECSVSKTDLNIDHLSELYEELLDEGLEPWQYSSVWFHTHPEMSANPSFIDEKTFEDIITKCKSPWLVMVILSKTEDFSAAIQINHPAKSRFNLGLSVDWDRLDEVDLQEVIFAGEEALAGVKKITFTPLYPVSTQKFEWSWEKEYRDQLERHRSRSQEDWKSDYETMLRDEGYYD